MSLENVGLGGVLMFDERQAVSGMKSAGSAADKFKGQFSGIVDAAKGVGAGFAQLGGAARGAGVAMMPATLAFGAGIDTAAKFEQQMSAVGAVSQATKAELGQLTDEAKKQSLGTKFSAFETGQAMEFLARAGFDQTETIAALTPVLNAAAAENIDLATTTDIVSNSLRALGKPATDAGYFADVLAVTSAKTNTSIVGMGESMKYAAGEAKTLGIELPVLAASLGVAADAGLRGAIGGTSFTQALIKLTKPSADGAALLEDMGIKMTKTAKGGLDMVDVFRQIHTKVKQIPNVMERARTVTEIFGVRGQKIFTAMETALDSGKLDSLVGQLENANGEAKKMAETRLDNFYGQLDLLTKAVSAFSIETMGQFLEPFKNSVKQYKDYAVGLVVLLKEINSEQGLTQETATKYGSTMVAIALGIRQGIDIVIHGYVLLRQRLMDLIAQFTGGGSEEMIQSFTKIATVIFFVAAAVAPVLVALGTIAYVITNVIWPVFAGLGSVIGAVFTWPVLAAIALVVGGFLMLQKDGETVKDTFTRIVDNIVGGFNWLMENGIKPILSGFEWFNPAFEVIWTKFKEIWGDITNDLTDTFGGIFQSLKALGPFFKVVFTFIGNIAGAAATIIGGAFTLMFGIVEGIFFKIRNVVLSVMESIVNFIKQLSFGLGYIAELAGFDWGKKMQDFGQDEFKIDVGRSERGMGGSGGSAAEDIVLDSNERDTMVVDQKALDAAAIGNAVGDAVAGAMPDELNVDSKVCVDGKTIARATGKHKQELSERAGFKSTPWAKRAAAEHGAVPARGT
jgi:TP901 family phage tail tape measure protein